MRLRFLSILLTATVLGASVAAAEHVVTRLRGIINLSEARSVVLEVTHLTSDSTRPPKSRTYWVKEGQSFEDQAIKNSHVQFEILKIDIKSETVTAREDGKEVTYGFQGAVGQQTGTESLATFGIHLENVQFEDVLKNYSSLKPCTVLVHPGVNWSPVSVTAEARDNAGVMAALEKYWEQQGISTVADGGKFVLMIPTKLAGQIKPDFKSSGSDTSARTTFYLDTWLSEAMRLYGNVMSKTFLGNRDAPEVRLYLDGRNQSREETQYAFDTLLGWHGLEIVSVDDKNFKVVRKATAR